MSNESHETSASLSETQRSIVRRLFECDALKFGDFTLKSGIRSPIYIDLRSIISQPDLMIDICDEIQRAIERQIGRAQYSLICGVPYTALTFATCIAARHDTPMVMRRKEAKNYGTKQILEGHYRAGQRALIIEDLISSGASILETVLVLEEAGLRVSDAIVFIDREQSGVANLVDHGITVHSVLRLSDVMRFLREDGHLPAVKYEDSMSWLAANRCPLSAMIKNELDLAASRSRIVSGSAPVNRRKNIAYAERAKACRESTSPLSARLFELMNSKRSNLCVAADLTRSEDIIRLARLIGKSIVALKLHVDIIEDFDSGFIERLTALAEEMRFILFADRKFADIGATVAAQYSGGLFRIADWAPLVTAHISPGPGVIAGLKRGAQSKAKSSASFSRGCVLIAQLSTEANLIPANYAQESYKLALENRDFVIGFISQRKITNDPTLICMTPGVKIGDEDGDGLGQRYVTPENAIIERGADIIIVGRGITGKFRSVEGHGGHGEDEGDDENDSLVSAAAEEYRRRGYDAYMNTL